MKKTIFWGEKLGINIFINLGIFETERGHVLGKRI
jgi:hypothetical protein